MEPMGPHRPRALKYTPTGGALRPIGLGPWNIPPWGPIGLGPEIYPHGGSSRPGSLRPIGPGPSALAHRPRPMEPMGPHMGMYFWILYFGAKSTLLGSQSVDSLALWGVQAESLFNKDCLQSFLGSLGPPRARLHPYTFL